MELNPKNIQEYVVNKVLEKVELEYEQKQKQLIRDNAQLRFEIHKLRIALRRERHMRFIDRQNQNFDGNFPRSFTQQSFEDNLNNLINYRNGLHIITDQ